MEDALIWVLPEADSETKIRVIFGTQGEHGEVRQGEEGRQLMEHLTQALPLREVKMQP